MPNLGVNVQACGSDVTQSDASDNSDSSTLQHMQPTASLDSVLCVDSSRLPRSGSNPASDSDEATKGSSTSSVDNRNGPRRFVTRRSSADDYVEPSRLSDGGAGPFVPPIDLHASSTPPDAAASMSKTPVADPGLGSSERRSTGSGGRDAVERGSHFEAARLISRQLHMNLPIIEQWKRSVEIMNQERSCADPSCRVCRWPRSTIVKVNPCTGEVKCKAMQRKFRENVRIAHFDSILRHLTTMLSCVYVLIGGYVYYNAATSKNLYFLTEERDFTPYPAIARGMVTLCWIITFLTLSFLWGVKLMPQAEACIARCKQRRKGKSGGRLRRQGSFKASRVSNPGNLRRSRHSSGSSSSYGQSLSLQERLYSCTHIGLSPIFVSLVVLSFVAFCFAMFFINMADFQVERLFLHYYFNNSFVLTEDCVQFEAGAILHVNSPNSTTVAPPPNATTYSPITFDPSTHPATTSQANATKLTVSQMLDVLRLCNNKVTVEEPWSALELDHGDDSDGDDDGDGDGSSPVHPQSIGTNTYRGNEEDFSDISYLVVNFLEDQNEVNMFVILLFGKFVALFLMVVHHIEFYYVLVTAVCLDVTAIATGSASISSDYIYFLGTETLFPFWVGVFCFSSVPLILTFGVLQRRAMQQFVVMYANAEDNLRFQRPNIVHDCLHVDTSAKGKIGAGSSGMVFRGRYAGFKVAVKELYSAQMDNNMEESFREAETLARLRHPNIVTFYGIGYSSEQDASTNDLDSVGNSKSFRIITELCSISLDRLLTNKAFHLDERKLCAIGLQIAYGMQYLHSINLEHYDMKPENVLIKKAVRSTTAAKHIHVKIADFGLARLVPMSSRKGASTPLRRGAVDAGWEDMRPAAGTFEYMPPEILRFERNRHVRSVMKARHPHVPLHGLPKVGEESSHRRSMRQLIQPVAATPTSSSNHRAAYALQEALYGSAVQVGSNNNLSQSGFNVLAAGDTPRHTDAMRYDRKKDKAKSSQLRQRSPTRSRTTERDTFSPPFESERPHSPIREGADLVVPYKWDVYSFGVVLWQMHSRKTPFYAATAAEYHSDTRPRTTTTAKIQATPSPPPKQQQAPSSRLPQPHASPEKNIDDSSPHATTLASAVTLALPSPSGEATPQHESKSSGGSIDSFASPNHSSTQMGVSPTSAACDAMMEFASSFADPQPQKLQPQGSGAARGAPAFGADVHPEILKAKKQFEHRLSRRLDCRILEARPRHSFDNAHALNIIGNQADHRAVTAQGMLQLLMDCTALGPRKRPGFNEVCRRMEEISRRVVAAAMREERLHREKERADHEKRRARKENKKRSAQQKLFRKETGSWVSSSKSGNRTLKPVHTHVQVSSAVHPEADTAYVSTPAKSKTSSAARATSKVSPMETSPPASDADDDNDDDGDDPGLEDYSNDDDDDGADPRLSQLRFSLRRGDTVSQTELAAALTLNGYDGWDEDDDHLALRPALAARPVKSMGNRHMSVGIPTTKQQSVKGFAVQRNHAGIMRRFST